MDPDATIPSGQNSSIFVRDALLHKPPSLVFHLILFYPFVMPSFFFRMLRFVLLMFRLLLAGSRVVLILGAVMLLTDVMFCFAMVLTVDA